MAETEKTAVTLYECDPARNTECSRAYCALDPTVLFGECRMTSNPAFARRDAEGKPIRVTDPF